MSSLLFPQKIRTLLVDDEELALHRLKKMLNSYSEIKIIAEVRNGKSAIDFINSERPDLVFLDIQMPEYNGLEVLSHLTFTPLIVFVTAYEEYAIKAFEKNSLDYLLKPVEEERLALTMKRIFAHQTGEMNMLLKLKKLVDDKETENLISIIPVKIGNKINFINVTDICYFEAKDKYVYIHTENDEKLIEYSLSYLQDRLPDQFMRVHRSFIINKSKIKELQKYFKGTYMFWINDSKNSKVKSAYSYAEIIKSNLLLS